jgi:hypothetical protein
MTLRVRMRVHLTAHEQCSSIYTGSYLAVILTNLISLRVTSTCLIVGRAGCSNMACALMKM